MTRSLAIAAVALGLLLAVAGLRTGSEEVEPASAVAQKPGPPPAADDERRRLFRPEDLPLLEGPDRALWQQPEEVMDALQIADGSKVADIGAGAGWFTIRLARRVKENGTVYAQDLQREMVIAIRRRVEREKLRNVRVIQGTEDSPGLPQHEKLDAVLAVDVYPEVRERVAFLRSLAATLKPNGRIGIVNYKPGGGGPGPTSDDRVETKTVLEEAAAAGLRVVQSMELRYQYLIVLGLPQA